MSLAIHNLNPLLKELNDALLLEDAAPVDLPRFGGQHDQQSAEGPWVGAGQSTVPKQVCRTRLEILMIF
ncbi:hypothetical protein LBMAG51_08370 [Phycisphaerae bacterium]|nr:hypothetical protein LBMAG51_08370 [Phycisphaerae bacterium]